MRKAHLLKPIALLLSLAMMVSMAVVPAYAAGTKTVYTSVSAGEDTDMKEQPYDEGTTFNDLTLCDDLGIGVSVAVTIDGSNVSNAKIEPGMNLPGTVGSTSFVISESSSRRLSLAVTGAGIHDDLDISVAVTPASYSIEANSGNKGENNNWGTDMDPTCGVSPRTQSVDGNEGWAVDFEPISDNLMITYLNIRSSRNGSGKLVSSATGSATIGSTAISINNSNGIVTVSSAHAADNLYITALTETKPAQYTLSVSTTGGVTSSVSSETLNVGTSRFITLTPDSGVLIDTISINDGGVTGAIRLSNNSVTVNGHRYTSTPLSNGKVTLNVPAITSNVSIQVVGSANKAVMTIDAGGDVDCNYSHITYFNIGESATVRLTPDDDAEITSIRISSTTDSVTLENGDYRFYLDGRVYRVDTRNDTSRVIYFGSIPGSISIKVDSKDAYHTVSIRTDSHIEYDTSKSSIRVDDGSSATFSFTADADYTIEQLAFTYGGRTYYMGHSDSSIRISGTRSPISWQNNYGKVTVTLYDIEQDITVRASTDDRHYDGSGDGEYVVRIDCDGGATFSHASRVYVDDGDNLTVTFDERSGYTIERLVITSGGKTYTASCNTSYLRINGERCDITWGSSKASIRLVDIDEDFTVYAETDYDGRDGDYVVMLETDGGADSSGSSRIYATRGTTKTVEFEPENGYTIEKIIITRAGRTYTADEDDSYIKVNGIQFPITWRSNGEVGVELRDIDANMTVKAETDYDGYVPSGSHKVTTRPDANSTIKLSTESSVIRRNESVTVTVSPKTGYTLDTVEFKLGSTTRTVDKSTHSFTYGGKTYTVKRFADDSLSVTFSKLPVDLTVTSTTKSNGNIIININPGDLNPQPTTPTGNYHVAYIQGYGNGLFCPYQSTSRAQAVVMLVRAFYGNASTYVTNTGTPFVDVASDAWFAPYIAYAYNQGILVGLNNVGSYFRPNDAITRAEYTELACRFAGATPRGDYGARFPDVPTNHWAYSSIGYAASRGWVNGFGDGFFRPDETITRAQMVAITNRVLGRIADRAFLTTYGNRLTSFSDVPASFWAYYEIMEAANTHYATTINGAESWQG